MTQLLSFPSPKFRLQGKNFLVTWAECDVPLRNILVQVTHILRRYRMVSYAIFSKRNVDGSSYREAILGTDTRVDIRKFNFMDIILNDTVYHATIHKVSTYLTVLDRINQSEKYITNVEDFHQWSAILSKAKAGNYTEAISDIITQFPRDIVMHGSQIRLNLSHLSCPMPTHHYSSLRDIVDAPPASPLPKSPDSRSDLVIEVNDSLNSIVIEDSMPSPNPFMQPPEDLVSPTRKLSRSWFHTYC